MLHVYQKRVYKDNKLLYCFPCAFTVKDMQSLEKEQANQEQEYKIRPGKFKVILLFKDRTKKNKTTYGVQLQLFNDE